MIGFSFNNCILIINLQIVSAIVEIQQILLHFMFNYKFIFAF